MRTGPHRPCLSRRVTAPQPLADQPVVGALGPTVPVAEVATGPSSGSPSAALRALHTTLPRQAA